jgi:AraC-like DNA-binding protein
MPVRPPAPLNPIPPGQIVAYFAVQRGAWRSKPHAHTGYELLYVSEGVKRFLLDGVEHTARAGDLIIFRPGDVHEEWSVSKRISRMVIRCHAQDLAGSEAGFPSSDRLGPVVRLPWRQRFQNLFARMAEERSHPKRYSQTLLGAYLIEFVVLLERAADALARGEGAKNRGEERAGARIRSALDLIHANVDRPLKLDEIARSAFMSPSYFSHVFREEAGAAPKQYAIKARIDRAKHLLATTELTAQEVAAELGFSSPYYFYRLFRKKTGQTAGEFARSARKCIPGAGTAIPRPRADP